MTDKKHVASPIWESKKTITQIDYHISFDDAISNDVTEYRDILNVIRGASEYDTIHLHLTTPGGSLVTTAAIISALANTNAKTCSHIEGPCHSAGTILALACDEVLVHPLAFMVFHNYSGGAWGKGYELKKYMNAQDDWVNVFFDTFYEGFLTEEELKALKEDNDTILVGTQDIQPRLERRAEMLKARAAAEEQEEEETLRETVRDLMKKVT